MTTKNSAKHLANRLDRAKIKNLILYILLLLELQLSLRMIYTHEKYQILYFLRIYTHNSHNHDNIVFIVYSIIYRPGI